MLHPHLHLLNHLTLHLEARGKQQRCGRHLVEYRRAGPYLHLQVFHLSLVYLFLRLLQ